MDSIVITLQLPQLQRSLDLEMPGELPFAKLLSALVQATGLPILDHVRRPLRYQLFLLRHEQLHPLREQDSLMYAGVLTGDVMVLTGGDSGVAVPLPTHNHSAVLHCPSGVVIALENFGKPELLMGRYDAASGRYPDVELSEEPQGSTVSRSHALLRKQGADWYVIPLTAQNYTAVQKKSLTAQQSYRLQDGNELVLGKVRLIFRLPSP